MTDISIDEFRLSFLFGRTVWEGVSVDADDSALPLAEMRARDAYAAWFERAREGRVNARSYPGEATPPWPANAEQGFWARYLQDDYGDERALRDVSGYEAFKQLVPVRVALPMRLAAPLDDTTVTAEGLLWPWGAAVAVTTIHRRPLDTLESTVRAAFALRDEQYELKEGRYHASPAPKFAALSDHADAVLDGLAAAAFGPKSAHSWRPLSIHSTIRARGPRERFDPRQDEVNRMLQAVTSFSPTWDSDELVGLEKARVAGLSIRPPDHIVFGARRGRAVWAPESFLVAGGATHTVGCHHRNLVMATLQTESLLRFLTATAARLRAGTALTVDQQWLARRATGALARLWAGEGTYRSGSLHDQIEHDSADRNDVNMVRQEVGQPAIAFT